MNPGWQSLFELIGTKVIVLTFLIILCRKLWQSFMSPFFTQERHATEEAEAARTYELDDLKQVLAKNIHTAQTNAERLAHIEKSFTLWQTKIAKQLQRQRTEQILLHNRYTQRMDRKNKALTETLEARETLEIVTSQTHRALCQAYAAETGAAALERLITKIVAEKGKAT